MVPASSAASDSAAYFVISIVRLLSRHVRVPSKSFENPLMFLLGPRS